jgi:hypothetical protein
MSPQAKSIQDVLDIARNELSLRARLSYVALFLVSLAGMAGLLSLWFSETALPIRTRLAFGTMTFICFSWAVLAVWALNVRRVLLARDRVIAGYMSVGFTGLFLIGALVAALSQRSPPAFAAAGMGVAMFGLAAAALVAARRRFMELVARRAALERLVASGKK